MKKAKVKAHTRKGRKVRGHERTIRSNSGPAGNNPSTGAGRMRTGSELASMKNEKGPKAGAVGIDTKKRSKVASRNLKAKGKGRGTQNTAGQLG